MRNTAALIMLVVGGTAIYSGVKGWSMKDTMLYFLGQKSAPTDSGSGSTKPDTPLGQQPLGGQTQTAPATPKSQSGGAGGDAGNGQSYGGPLGGK